MDFTNSILKRLNLNNRKGIQIVENVNTIVFTFFMGNEPTKIIHCKKTRTVNDNWEFVSYPNGSDCYRNNCLRCAIDSEKLLNIRTSFVGLRINDGDKCFVEYFLNNRRLVLGFHSPNRWDLVREVFEVPYLATSCFFNNRELSFFRRINLITELSAKRENRKYQNKTNV